MRQGAQAILSNIYNRSLNTPQGRRPGSQQRQRLVTRRGQRAVSPTECATGEPEGDERGNDGPLSPALGGEAARAEAERLRQERLARKREQEERDRLLREKWALKEQEQQQLQMQHEMEQKHFSESENESDEDAV